MKINKFLTKNRIIYAESGRDLAIYCPFCNKSDGIGEKMLVLNINQETGNGECCGECKKTYDFLGILEKLRLNTDIIGVSNGEIEFVIKKKTVKEDDFQILPPEPEPLIDTSQFKLITLQEVSEILGLTIKKDDENKIVTFLCELAAYTDNAQFNISFNAPSSTGKSYIPTEIARLFPKEDVLEIGYCSPTAFFHDIGEPDKEKKGRIIIDLSRKILIFLDQPHNHLLERLRPLLSHDKKEVSVKITDKNQKQGLRTKNAILKGFPSVIFCTAGLKIDEQEITRFILLSPETNQEKIRLGIDEKIRKEVDNDSYQDWLDEQPGRSHLKERLLAIRQAGIKEIKICSEDAIREQFLKEDRMLKPRHQRDIGRLLSLIKAIALLNLWWRNQEGSTITANEDDIRAGFAIWDKIVISQELNLPPFIYKLCLEVVLPLFMEKNTNRNQEFKELNGILGLERSEILKKHSRVYGRPLDDARLRQQILPMLEDAGLITQEQNHPTDKRKVLIYPTEVLLQLNPQNNSESDGGVNTDSLENDRGINTDELPF